MSDTVQQRDQDTLLWKPVNARLDRPTFARGLALVAAAERRELTDEVSAAYYSALAGVEPVDFVTGVQHALRRERFMTPAALYQACEEARQTREENVRERAWLEEQATLAEEREARRREAEARTAALRAEAEGWKAPPADAEELRARIVLLLELRGGQSDALCLARRAQVSGTVQDIVLKVERGAFFRRAAGILTDAATEAAGQTVRVTVRDAEAPDCGPSMTAQEWESRRERLRRQAEDLGSGSVA